MAARKNAESVSAPSVTPPFVRKAAPVDVAGGGEKSPSPDTQDTVCVALNRPLGLSFRLPDGRKVALNGNGAPLAGKEKGVLPVGTYGLTLIKRDVWDYILKTYGEMKVFKNGLCFATNSRAESEQEAASRNDLRNGFEPVDPKRTVTSEARGEA